MGYTLLIRYCDSCMKGEGPPLDGSTPKDPWIDFLDLLQPKMLKDYCTKRYSEPDEIKICF